jgi:hypothetical protein
MAPPTSAADSTMSKAKLRRPGCHPVFFTWTGGAAPVASPEADEAGASP